MSDPRLRREVSRNLAGKLPNLVDQGDATCIEAVSELLAQLHRTPPADVPSVPNVINLASRRKEKP